MCLHAPIALTNVSACFQPPVVAALILIAMPFRSSLAEDLLGPYVGGAAGQSQVEAAAPYAQNFREIHSAFKFIVGIRPISLVGVEVAYDDFGRPNRRNGELATDVKMKGESAFGVLYLPVPIVDIFLKAGLARIDSTAATHTICSGGQPCPTLIADPEPESRTNVGFAGGAGAQFKIGSLAVRGEYERFNAAGRNPSLLSVGIIWKFL
jgi:opacity protein-like surface antigen